jgi:hypothetical protein
MFPVTREEPLVKLSMLQPQVMLSPENERIGLRLTLLATFPNDTDMTGETVVDGTLRYDITTTALYLDDPEIRFLEIDGIAPAVTREIRTMANGILATYLRSTPIHVLNQKGTASGSSARLKNVRVQQGKLVLDLGS